MLVQVDDFVLEVGNLVSLRLDDSEFALKISNRVVQNLDIQKTLLVLVLTLGKSGLQNLDLLVQESQLVISANELSSEHITLVDDLCDFLLLNLVLVVGLLNNVGELKLLHLELVDDTGQLFVLKLLGVHFVLVLVGFLLGDTELVLSGGEGGILGLDFVLELRNLVGCNSELTLELRHFILGLNKILRVEVTVGSDSLIQVLLSLELTLEVDVFLLELADKVLLELDFLDHLHEVGVGFGSFK